MTNQLLQRITLHQDICHGKPCIRGLSFTAIKVINLDELRPEYDLTQLRGGV